MNSIPNDTGRTLNLILSTDASTTVTLSDEALVPADNYHTLITTPLIIEVKKSMNHSNVSGPQNDIFYYDFKSADLSLLNDCLGQVNWDKLLFNHSVDNMVNIFYDILYFFIQALIPQKKVSKRKFPLWFLPELKS